MTDRDDNARTNAGLLSDSDVMEVLAGFLDERDLTILAEFFKLLDKWDREADN